MIVEVKEESIQQIAQKYQTTVAHVQSTNQLQTVRKGMRLWIDGSVKHVVGPRDTIESVASTWGVRLEDIEKDNATPIRVGQVLTIRL